MLIIYLLHPDLFDQVENPLDNLDEEESSSLNHDHSKERARLARAGKIARKPPSRRNSSNVLPEGKSACFKYFIATLILSVALYNYQFHATFIL